MVSSEKFIKKINFRNRQKEINRMFEEEGLTDEILMKQVRLNKERHDEDIHDESEETYREYVQ